MVNSDYTVLAMTYGYKYFPPSGGVVLPWKGANVFQFEQGPERRYKMLWISPELLLAALFSPQRDGDKVRVVEVDGLPYGCKVEAVRFDEDRRAFVFRLWHESFDVVPLNYCPPEVTPECRAVELLLKTEKRTGREFI